MKKTRKLLALVLALMMAFSCMAMPAMAHGDEDEGIMPLGEVGTCPYCGKTGRVTRENYTHTYYTTCTKASSRHQHTTYYNFIEYECGHVGGGEYDVCGIQQP